MLIFIDKRSSENSKKKLSDFGNLIEFETQDIVDDYISGHPDLFICQTPSEIICSPNLPRKYQSLLCESKTKIIFGKKIVTQAYPECAIYNAVVNNEFIIHKTSLTDSVIQNLGKEKISVSQGMTRCSLISLDSNNFITSDSGIAKKLSGIGKSVCCVNPKGIVLPGKPYGLIGGTAGVHKNKIFFNGSLNKFPEGQKIINFLNNLNFEIIELDNTPLFDGGSIFFID